MNDKVENIIPKTIHYCWFGKGEMPPLAKACLESWKQHMPDWNYVLWNEENLPDELPFAKKLLERKLYAFVSDYVRLYAIWKQGGIYLDTDIEVFRTLDPLLKNSQFLGYERQGRATNGVCGGVASASFFLACMNEMDRHYSRSDNPALSPEICTALINRSRFPDLKIYPPHVFYPYNPYDKSRAIDQLMFRDIRPDTMVIHHWAKSWRLSFFTRVRRKLEILARTLFSSLLRKLDRQEPNV
jgi:mannosyltransferase OCH1-like enzyme